MRVASQGVVLAALVLSLVSVPSVASGPAQQIGKPPLDVRLPAADAARAGWVMREPAPLQRAAAEALRAAVPGVTLRWDGLSGAPKWIGAPAGATLSAPLAGTPEEAARAFLQANAALYGLTGREVEQLRVFAKIPGASGDVHVHFVQVAGGLEVFGSAVNVNLRPDNAVVSVGSTLFGGLDIPQVVVLPAADAAMRAARDVYPDRVFTATPLESTKTREQFTRFAEDDFARPVEARLVVFPTQDGARPAWEVRVAEGSLSTDYVLAIDAFDGSVLFRRNVTLRAQARVLTTTAPDPVTEEDAPAQHQLQTIPASTPQSPNGWIEGTGTSLAGNNCTTHLRYWTQPGLAEPDGIYDYRFNTLKGALANAWWWANDAHDRFYALGFDEVSGNFQIDNFGRGGTGGDSMRVVHFAGADRWDAFFNPMALDGSTSTINFAWVPCLECGDHDGYPENGGDRASGFDRGSVQHEYTHGVTSRSVVGSAAPLCLAGTQSAALGEGWSDLFPASFFGETRLDPASIDGPGWLRGLRHDLDYGDFCKTHVGCQPHGDGMIWAGTLWTLRESLRALDPVAGLDAFHRILMEGLKKTPCTPDYLDARDALLAADTSLFGSAHHKAIWNVFASRGMGQNASTTGDSDTAPVAGFTVPGSQSCTPPAVPTLSAVVPTGDNALRLDFNAPGASAIEIWRDDLYNGLDVAGRTASAKATSPYVDETVLGGRSYRYYLVALGGGGMVCRSAASAPAQATASGSCAAFPVFDPGLTVVDGDPSCAMTLVWTAASQGCPLSPEPIVYNVYRGTMPGFEPSARALIGRTDATTFRDTPPQDKRTYYYLVLAQHGTLDDPPDHRDRGSSQVMRWVPRVPALGRTTVQFWDFESGTAGWTTDNNADPTGGWVLVDPSPTRWEEIWFAPPDAAGGSGKAWVTGDAGGASSIADVDNHGPVSLTSPTWDGTGGATIFSFDYWSYIDSYYWGLSLQIHNGSTTTTIVDIVPLLTVQTFDTAARHSWQRAEVDLADFITPTATMSVTITTDPGWWLDEFGVDNVRVEQGTVCGRSALRLIGLTVDDATPGWGNANGVLEPGETVRLVATVENDGSTAAIAPRGTLRVVGLGVLVHEETASFPDIAPGGTAASAGPGFTVTLPPDRGCLETSAFTFEIEDAAGTVSTAAWNLELGHAVTETVFRDTFETDKGWTAVGFEGSGKWQRGDPVGTTVGVRQANPENDSPNDPGTFCFVTENGPVGGSANANDVDSTFCPWLHTPYFDLRPYKRARMTYDLWYFDNSSSSPTEDFGLTFTQVNDQLGDTYRYESAYYIWDYDPTGDWQPRVVDLTPGTPMIDKVFVNFYAYDTGPDSIVEMGIDNFKVVGDRQVCDALGVTMAPNGVGATLMVTKSEASADLVWTASPVDGDHNAAAYYELFVSAMPIGAFHLADTSASTQASRALAGENECYLVTAVNAAGTSGDEPEP